MDTLNQSHVFIGLITNIVFEPYFKRSAKSIFGDESKLYQIQYNELYKKEYQNQLKDSTIIIIWLNIESLFPGIIESSYQDNVLDAKNHSGNILDICVKLCSDVMKCTNARILFFLFEDYFTQLYNVTGYCYSSFVDDINITLCKMLSHDITTIDLKRIIASISITDAYDYRGKIRWNAPYSKLLINETVKEINKHINIDKGVSKKCLVLDCDNVLWGGIISEDGIENLKLGGIGSGRVYQNFQRFVLSLYYHGVILAVCSKNELSDVITVFREHNEMILKEHHIACFQVNWDNKPGNIKRISDLLNIGTDSIVFVDDSINEIDAVNSMLPEVFTILYERYMSYDKFSCFNLKDNINITSVEDRNQTYKTNQYRRNLHILHSDSSDYIEALNMKINIRKTSPIEFNRISELSQRTNKCTNGKRYTVTEIKNRFFLENIQQYSISVSDCFSDLGIVGTMEVEDDCLTLFVLSCRALGREIEFKMLDFISEKYTIDKIIFHPTGKNEDTKIIITNKFPSATFVYEYTHMIV